MENNNDLQELTLQEIQQLSLRILTDVAALCQRLGLRYYLAYGSLIGAIRHQGFIPWDDDLDIMMPRKDYQRLLAYFQEHAQELAPLELFSIYNKPDYPYMISRISHSGYRIVTDNERSYGLGAFIDIYPLDGVGSTQEVYTALKNKASRYSSLCFLSTRLRCEKGNTKKLWKQLIKFPAFLYAHLMGKEYFFQKLETIAGQYDYETSAYVGCLVWGSDGVKGIFPKAWFDKSVEVSFAGHSFLAPAEYHKVLQRLYGDYMQLPPEADRIGHHFYRMYKK